MPSPAGDCVLATGARCHNIWPHPQKFSPVNWKRLWQ